MSTRVLVAMALTLGLGWSCHAQEPHPIYRRLRAYRNTFQITGTSPMAERFTAWFVRHGYVRADFGANSPEEIRDFEEKDLHLSSGSLALPPGAVDPIPPALEPFAAALGRRLQELFPEHQDLQVAYRGRRRTISIEEVTSFSTAEDPEDRFCRRSWLTLAAAEGSTQLEPSGSMQAYGGIGRLVPHRDPERLPTFVDYVSPPALEGSALCYAHFRGLGGAFEAAWDEFSVRLLQAADALEDGSYENPIEGVLAAQGETELPPGLDPWLEYDLRVYARAEDFQDQVDDHQVFRFRLRDVVEGPVALSRDSAATGLAYRVELDLERKLLALKVETAAGVGLKLEYAVTGEILRTPEGVAVENAWLEVAVDGEEHQLPGTGGFTRFDVYPETSVRTTRVFVPAPPQGTRAPASPGRDRKPTTPRCKS